MLLDLRDRKIAEATVVLDPDAGSPELLKCRVQSGFRLRVGTGKR